MRGRPDVVSAKGGMGRERGGSADNLEHPSSEGRDTEALPSSPASELKEREIRREESRSR